MSSTSRPARLSGRGFNGGGGHARAHPTHSVIPAQAGIQGFEGCARSAQLNAGALGPRLRGGDGGSGYFPDFFPAFIPGLSTTLVQPFSRRSNFS
jgi:hypothetical protein